MEKEDKKTIEIDGELVKVVVYKSGGTLTKALKILGAIKDWVVSIGIVLFLLHWSGAITL